MQLNGHDVDSSAEFAPLVIVGAGPVGCTAALAFAKSGWRVAVYETRPASDLRLSVSEKGSAQRSVNLAVSSRGLAALYSVEPSLMHRILENAIPMKGRLLHLASGKTESQSYDPSGQCIYSIDRNLLNRLLLEEALKCPTIEVHFNHKLVAADFDTRLLTFSVNGPDQTVDIQFSLCIGADGSYSNVRRQMMRVTRMNYQQEYIPHDYVELKIPAGVNESGNKFLLDPNHLHIWPRHSFMLIALPNKDKSFTSTVFAPTLELEKLSSRKESSAWLKQNFPDAVALVGEEALLSDFQRNPRNSLISLKVSPYHYKDRCLILGDAAHSMVPFFGQGLNCGLEDVRVLVNILTSHGAIHPKTVHHKAKDIDLERAFQEYTHTRHHDLVAICDLAMDNYVEMRHTVTTPTYIFRKMIDNVLAALTAPHVSFLSLVPNLANEPSGFSPAAPSGWLPLYRMVTFRPDISYEAAKRKVERQNTIIKWIGVTSLGIGICLGLVGVRRLVGSRGNIIGIGSVQV